jgi:hypothetical protein
MSTNNTSWVKGGQYVLLATLTPSCADRLEVQEINIQELSALVIGLYMDCFAYTKFKYLSVRCKTTATASPRHLHDNTNMMDNIH